MALHKKNWQEAEVSKSVFNTRFISFPVVYPQWKFFLTSLALFVWRKKKCHPQMFKTCLQSVKINVPPDYGSDSTNRYECRKGISCLFYRYLLEKCAEPGIAGKQKDCDACRYCDSIENA
jgi:hypothetical protein